MTPENKETLINESRLTLGQRALFHTLVNDGMIEMNAYIACLSIE